MTASPGSSHSPTPSLTPSAQVETESRDYATQLQTNLE